MKLVFATLCFIFVYISFLPFAHSSLIQDKETVRVRLLTAEKIEITGLGLSFQSRTEKFQPVSIPKTSRAEVRILNKDGKKIWAVSLNNQEPERLFVEPYLFVQGESLRAGAQALPSRVLLSVQGDKGVDVVGVMPLDEYIVGVLASEMPLSWPLETLKAQAVAARSYALAVMTERRNQAFHLESSILDQVFRHVLREDENDPLIKKALQAVRETKGVKLYAGVKSTQVLKAYFHSDCGGKTTTAKSVWNTSVNSGVATDSSCPTNPRAQWKLSLTKEELLRRLQLEDFVGLNLIKDDSRVKSVRLALNETEEKVYSANEFRQKLGFQDLRSSLFDFKKVGESYLFQGQGYGHGVGLCQWGSRALGQRGHDYKQILKHYYPLARLQ